MDTHQAACLLTTKYRKFTADMNEIWDAFNAIEYCVNITRKHTKLNPNKVLLKIPYIEQKNTKQINDKGVHELLDHISQKRILRMGVIEPISIFEVYLADLIKIVYRTFPEKLKNPQLKEEHHQLKYHDLILMSKDKDSMINKIIENKIRNIMYKNPNDIFIKDVAKLEVGGYFKKHYPKEIKEFNEINGRRNIYVHNEGRVNEDYLKIVGNTNYKIGQSVPVDSKYIKESIKTIKEITLMLTAHLLKKMFKNIPPRPKLIRACRRIQ